MSSAMKVIGALTLAAGVLMGVFVPDLATSVRIGAVAGAVVTSLLWFALGEILDRLNDVQVMVGRPSTRGR